MGTVEAIERAIAPVLSTLGFELVDIEARPGVVRVTIDRPLGLDIAAISEATHAVSGAIDTHDAVPGGRYELEVSSPGVERRLRTPEHFSRAIGSELAVKLRPGAEGERRLEGKLTKVEGKAITLEVSGTALRVAYADIDRAHTVFDWRAALAADSAARSEDERNERRANRPSASERSRAATAAAQGANAGAPATTKTLPAATTDKTETA